MGNTKSSAKKKGALDVSVFPEVTYADRARTLSNGIDPLLVTCVSDLQHCLENAPPLITVPRVSQSRILNQKMAGTCYIHAAATLLYYVGNERTQESEDTMVLDMASILVQIKLARLEKLVKFVRKHANEIVKDTLDPITQVELRALYTGLCSDGGKYDEVVQAMQKDLYVCKKDTVSRSFYRSAALNNCMKVLMDSAMKQTTPEGLALACEIGADKCAELMRLALNNHKGKRWKTPNADKIRKRFSGKIVYQNDASHGMRICGTKDSIVEHQTLYVLNSEHFADLVRSELQAHTCLYCYISWSTLCAYIDSQGRFCDIDSMLQSVTGQATGPGYFVQDRHCGIDHAVCIVQHPSDKTAVLILNSWGDKWGKHGLCACPIAAVSAVAASMDGISAHGPYKDKRMPITAWCYQDAATGV